RGDLSRDGLGRRGRHVVHVDELAARPALSPAGPAPAPARQARTARDGLPSARGGAPAGVGSSPVRPQPGTTIASVYVVEGFLGEGGMGSVWSARVEGTGERVALKVMRPGATEHRARFERE